MTTGGTSNLTFDIYAQKTLMDLNYCTSGCDECQQVNPSVDIGIGVE